MDWQKKIENVRQQPEHIRMRYVWGAVGISMFFVLLVWVFSLKEAFTSVKSENSGADTLKTERNNLKANAPSLKDFVPGESASVPEKVVGNNEIRNPGQEAKNSQ